MVSGGIIKDGLSKSKIDSCWISGLRGKANLVLCVQCGKLIHSRCATKKRMTKTFLRSFASGKYEGNIGKAVEQEETLCDEVETAREFTYLGDRVSAGGGCKMVVTGRPRCVWVKLRECIELLHGRRLLLKLEQELCKASNTVLK